MSAPVMAPHRVRTAQTLKSRRLPRWVPAAVAAASILVAVQDSAEKGYLFELSQRIWTASNELKTCSSSKPFFP